MFNCFLLVNDLFFKPCLVGRFLYKLFPFIYSFISVNEVDTVPVQFLYFTFFLTQFCNKKDVVSTR